LSAVAALRSELPFGIAAVHVNHGLSPMAPRWAEHASRVCRDLDIPLELIHIDARAPAGESPEACARARRYDALRKLIQREEILLTAHHQDDQAETLLLQLLRGAGPKGLAAMPFIRRFGVGWLARPLLDLSRETLRDDAHASGLAWVDDPSNADVRFDRNFLRAEILPRLRERWPQLGRTLARAATLQAEADAVLEDAAARALETIIDAENLGLEIQGLLDLSPAIQGLVLRAWLRGLGLAIPGLGTLKRVHAEVIAAAQDAQPRLQWTGGEIRRYRGRLYACQPVIHEFPAPVLWPRPNDLDIAGGRLSSEPVLGSGIRADLWQSLVDGAVVQIRFREGGERLRPAGSRHSRLLKHLFQDAGIPPWERPFIPLIYAGDHLAAVAGFWVSEGYQALPGESGFRLRWQRPAPALAGPGEMRGNQQ
jgi:tRNA(Ile)-lysidine synthase